ncbi:MAG: hypothetical protein PHS77_03745 [Gallionellaceae bacterium]|nr:hypothetical protein [Gallionellaceae bacterium]
MKKLSVQIRAELEVPDDWELVEHPSGMQVLRIGEQFVDFDIAPLVTRSSDPEAEWSDEDATIVGAVLDTVVDIDVDLDLRSGE